jgi:glycerophosphoryl diester phosphodiesterase
VIAHRAGPLDAPENSLTGVRRAAELGADGVEIDVRGTCDGVPVVMHDWLLLRTTNRWWPVRWIPSRWFRRSRLKGSTDPPPRLEDVLRDLPDDLQLAIEVKQASITEAVLTEVHRWGRQDRVLIWAESGKVVRYLSEAAPEIEVALLRTASDPPARERMLDDAVRWGARAVSIAHTEVDPANVAAIRHRGLKVYSCLQDLPSTVPEQVALLDGLITDHVADGVATVGTIHDRPDS